jgi:excisionase family DNA binding protein
MTQTPNRDLKAPEAAEYLGLSLRTFYYFVQQGKIPRIIYGPRVTRFDTASLDAYRQSCRSDTIKVRNAGASNSTGNFPTENDTALLNSFRKAGVKIKPEHLTYRKAPACTPLRAG